PTVTAPAPDAFLPTHTPRFSGTYPYSGRIIVRKGTQTLCTATIDSYTYEWSCESSVRLAEGLHSYTVRATLSTISSVTTGGWLTVDVTLPEPPLISTPASNARINTRVPLFTGTAEPGGTVTVTWKTRELCTALVDAVTGAWSCRSRLRLNSGSTDVTATVRDRAGNESYESWRPFVVDAAPLVLISPAQAQTVNTAFPTFQGTAEPEGLVEVWMLPPNVRACQTTAQASGSWSCTSTVELLQGNQFATVYVTDPAGLVSSSPTRSFTVDSVAPSAPVLSSPTPGQSLPTASLTLQGTAEAGSFVAVHEGTTLLCEATTRSTGDWACALVSLAAGVHTLTFTARDAAQNTGPASTATFTVDLQAPATPGITAPLPGQMLVQATPVFQGTAEPGSTVTVHEGSRVLCTAVSHEASGAWACTALPLADGAYTSTVTASDPAGNRSPPGTVSFTVDTTRPDAPAILHPRSNEPIATASPRITGTSEPGGSVSVVLDEVTTLGPILVSEQGTWSHEVPLPLTDGLHTLSAFTVDAAGNAGPSVALTFFVDTVAPDTELTRVPAQASNSARATFEFSSTGGGTRYECSLDAEDFVSCGSPFVLDALSEGEHLLAVRAVDAAGNRDPSPAGYTWTVDLSAPSMPVITSPAIGAIFNGEGPVYAGTAEPGAQVRLFLDGTIQGGVVASAMGAWSFGSGLTVSSGLHTVSVTATDAVGNVSPEARVTFSVDRDAPETALSASVPVLSNSPEASFTFSSEDSRATFECRFDTGAFTSCIPPLSRSGLTDGTYTVQVRAVDMAGNVDPTPASFTWTVDRTAPDTFIRSGPPADDAPLLATFELGSDETGVTYLCSLDDSAFIACGSPAEFSVAPGRHTLVVRARDAAGNVDGSAASWSWTATDDGDHDGLSDEDESHHGTDPRNPDTDGDGVSDGNEVKRGTDPRTPDDGDLRGHGCSTGGAGAWLPLALGLLALPFLGRRRRGF
ncbi:hypothetical protein D7W79_36985, partial [Corallococcus exercitus]|uniref:Ig-like domain-containing protein n=1 Tax=Corallococcus exercitus TaxID=2316736 RepID=UPI000EBAE6AF